MYLILVAVAWLYVALLMAVAEATSPIGSVLGAVFTFLLYGVGPVAIVLYILNTPARRRAKRLADQAADAESQASAAASSPPPDEGGETPADPVAPVREKP